MNYLSQYYYANSLGAIFPVNDAWQRDADFDDFLGLAVPTEAEVAKYGGLTTPPKPQDGEYEWDPTMLMWVPKRPGKMFYSAPMSWSTYSIGLDLGASINLKPRSSGKAYSNFYNSLISQMLGWSAQLEERKPPSPLPVSEQTEVIIGWRQWRVVEAGNIALLRSCYQDEYFWPVGEAMKADTKPGQRDNCGVHAVQSRTYAATSEDYDSRIYGTVALWGKVIEHEKGWRAEFAYPQALYPMRKSRHDKELCRKLARIYGCEAMPDAP